MNRKAPDKVPLALAIAATIRAIPRGKVSTYGAVAKAAGYPSCARHVARVLQTVPGLPWQRVLGAEGRISLPGEFGFEQRFLLQAEGVRFKGKRADMANFEYKFPPTRKSGRAARDRPS
jgi:methylated-DNA-protein-cysteine methyltransferase related protein